MMIRAKSCITTMAWTIRRRRTNWGLNMKRKLLALGLFSLCSLALFASESQAFFGLLHPYHPNSLWHKHNRYVTHITCRPYNAFTPICWGNLVCDGCNPSPCGVASGCLPMQFGVPPFACGSACPGYGHATDMPMPMPMPPIHSNPYTAPMPQPLPAGPGTTMMMPNGVSQANYYPMNYYMPTYYNPYQMWQPNPYYWYGYGR